MLFQSARRGCESDMVAGRRRGIFTFLVVLVVLVVPVTLEAAEGEVRSLLWELRIQVPSQTATAPAFSLRDLSGKPVQLADYKDRAVMLYFWTTY